MTINTNGSDKTLTQVRALLEQGKVAEARNLLMRVPSRSPAQQNALGVCLMRMGESTKAIELYRNMVLTEGGVCFRSDAPPVTMLNFATALLLSGNIYGSLAMLEEAKSVNGHGAARIRDAIKAWKRSLSPLRRLQLVLTGPPRDARVTLGFPPGEL